MASALACLNADSSSAESCEPRAASFAFCRSARKFFLADLEKAKEAKMSKSIAPEVLAAFKHAKADAVVSPVDGQVFYEFHGDGEGIPCLEPSIGQTYKDGDILCYVQATWGEFIPIPAGIGGRLVDISAKKASHVRRGDTLAWIEREKA